jgi:4-aminobutyrate aminotransferase
MTMGIDRTEGDVNRSSRRDLWRSGLMDEKTRHWLEMDERYFMHQPLSTPCLDVLVSSSGSRLTNLAGRSFLDFHGNNVHQAGHAHPAVLQAVREQLDTLAFSPRRYTNKPAILLAQQLAERAPGRLRKVLFAPGGTLAIGMALKLARLATGRHGTISFRDSFHGASLDAISVGGEEHFREGIGPLMPGAVLLPPPDHDTHTPDAPAAARRAAQAIEDVILSAGNIGAVVAEPFRYTTVQVPHPAFWRTVREICDRHGVLLIFDEIPVCLGRTGSFYACERFGVIPDIICIGKGLGGGVMPIAAMIAREDLDRSYTTSLGHYTHEKNPVAAAAALALIGVIEGEGLMDRAMEMGVILARGLEELRSRHPVIGAVRSFGLAVAAELTPRDGTPAWEIAEKVMYASLGKGLSFKVSGGSVLTLMPPLTISREEIGEALEILDGALTAAC